MDSMEKKLNERKDAVTKKIKIKNIELCKENVTNDLEFDEEIKYRFTGIMGSLTYIASTQSFDFKFVPGVAGAQMGLNYLAYVTNKRLFVYELDTLNRIKKDYIISFKEIEKFKCKIKKGTGKFDFKLSEGTKNEMRETYFLNTSFFKNRIVINSTSENVEEIKDYIENKILEAKAFARK